MSPYAAGLALLAMGACGNHPLASKGVDAESRRDVAIEVGVDAEASADQRESSGTEGGFAPDVPADAGSPDAAGDSLAPATIQISNAVVYADCMPTSRENPDPIIAFWTVAITGAASRPVATLTDATLTITGSNADARSSLRQHLVVDNPSIALAGGLGTASQRKTGADLRSSSVCFELCRDATWSLDLTFDLGTASTTGAFSCPM